MIKYNPRKETFQLSMYNETHKTREKESSFPLDTFLSFQ